MNKIALFDFCGTITNYQTLDPYLEYVVSREMPEKYKFICNPALKYVLGLISMTCRLFGVRRYFYKRLLIKQMKGIPRDKLKAYGTEYYAQTVRKNLIGQTIELIRKCQKEGYYIVILSAGSDLYIEEFAREYGIDRIITATFGFDKQDICTGELLSECIGKGKMRDLEKAEKTIPKPREWSLACSDSRSDLPMLNLCKKKVVVSHNRHQDWVFADMQEIIWQ